ncbi:MAG: AbrB/MazE/SpoVT family DNA-binding domain-containing protein [Nanoarchaeota archaeon]|nr:AbrB/MazE/SpoVT family DNA-binding domain-containing protein [DPANN group archaeon]MBL7116432.1 AbrB/MazE/SpoVT family DNA-binding domain-containing protein [Nanoarchaeota archaeon]
MKRKVIQHSPTSLVVTLPARWAKKNYVKKGEEIDLIENSSEIIIRKGLKHKELLEVNIDISALDKTTILHVIRNLYRAGYDKINIEFDKERVPYDKIKGSFLVTEIIHQETRRLLGYEITREKKNNCIIESISEGITEELPTIIRRVHLLLIDIAETLTEAARRNDKALLSTIREKHETIIRFINYCLRSGAKELDNENPITKAEYHRLATFDRIVHLLRSSAKRLLRQEKRASKELIKVMERTVESLRLFHKFIYTKKSTIVKDLNNIRYEVEKIIYNYTRPNTDMGEEDLVFFHFRHIHHILLDVCDVRGLS